MSVMKKVILTAVIPALLLGACTTQPSQSSLDTVHIGTFSSAIDYAPYYIAKNQGWFEEAAKKYGAAKVEYTEFQSLPPINEAIATNNMDIVFEAEPPALIGKAAGIDLKIKGAGVILNEPLLVRKGAGIASVKDLKGRKIAALSGTSAHYWLLKILEQNGLSKNDAQVIDMSPPDARAAFESGDVDAWAIWSPWVEQQEIAGKGEALPNTMFIQSIIIARGGFDRDYPALTKDIVAVVQKAKEWIMQNPAQAQQIVSTELKLPLEVVQKAWPRHDFQATIGPKEVEDIQAKADFLFDLGLVKNRVNVAKDMIDVE